MLEISTLSVSIEEQCLLRNISLTLPPGQLHVMMGPNGAGKSTFAKTLAGHPSCDITAGNILLKKDSLLDLSMEERALRGLFISWQHPVEIPGVPYSTFLYTSYCALCKAGNKEVPSRSDLNQTLSSLCYDVGFDPTVLERQLHVGFSGGEKKKSELLQWRLFSPAVAVFDEIDSGVDIKAIQHLLEGIEKARRPDQSLLFITHSPSLARTFDPDVVHIVNNSELVYSGSSEILDSIEEKGYDHLTAELVSA